MALSIRSKHVEVLARRLSEETGENITDVILSALKEKEDRILAVSRKQKIDEILERMSSLPVLDPRAPDEIIGYDEYGLPGGR